MNLTKIAFAGVVVAASSEFIAESFENNHNPLVVYAIYQHKHTKEEETSYPKAKANYTMSQSAAISVTTANSSASTVVFHM